MNNFGYVVKKYLLDNNLKQQSISDNSELSKGAVSQLLNRNNISLDKMLMISEALNCDLEITLKPRIDSSENDNSVKEAVFCKV
jgi:transcriptional regulator with XRE-family HTH domain